MRKQKGMAALMVTMTILAVVTIITLFTARVIVTDNKIYSNVRNNMDALNAAQAGFDYALGYLNAFPYVLIGTATPNGLGYCASAATTYSLPSGTLANGSTYTMTFSCMTASDFVTFKLTTVGTSKEGTSTRTINATLKQFCGVSLPLVSRGALSIINSAVISNPISAATRTIDSGGTTTLSNTATATSTTGGAYSCAVGQTPPTNCRNIRSTAGVNGVAFANPVTTTLTVAGGMTDANFQQLYLGRQMVGAGASTFQSMATTYNISCTSGAATKTFLPGTTFSSVGCSGTGSGTALSAITGAIIYMNMGSRNLVITTTGGGTTTIGSSSAHVILVVNSTTGTVTLTTSGGAGSTLNFNGNIYTTVPTLEVTEGNSGTTTVNGLIFGTQTINLDKGGTATTGPDINGALVANTPTITDGSIITYNPTNIANTFNGFCGGAYSVVPGSWRDF